jgi:hypothetical protein
MGPQEIFQKFKNHLKLGKLSENCWKHFHSSKQLLSIDKNMLKFFFGQM